MNIFNEIVHPKFLGEAPLDKNMTFAVKANIGCGLPASASTPSLQGWIPKDYSLIVRSLEDAGHKNVAITNMHELAFGITSENPTTGAVDNPHKSGYIAGGSSGGSAAAVAINAVSFSLGTDTGGSIRIPAALCGVVGYRPTTKLYDTSAVCPLSSTDTIGIFAQHVHTVQQVHKAVITSYSPTKRSLKGVRIGVPRQYYYSLLDDEVSRVVEVALERLKEAKVELVEVDIPFKELAELIIGGAIELVTYEAYRLLPEYLEKQNAPVKFDELYRQIYDPAVKGVFTNADKISIERYEECQHLVTSIHQLFDDYFKMNDLKAFVCPSTILPAVKRPSPNEVEVHGKNLSTFAAYIHNSIPQSCAGVPCISLPCGLSSDGLPIGLEVVAPRDDDSSLLDLAASIQEVLPSLPKLSYGDFKNRL